jgi:hypothetical protein
MNAPGSIREALIAEAIGDLGRMIEQAQALQKSMTDSRQALVEAHGQLARQLVTLDAQLSTFTEKAKTHVVKHIQQRTEEAARRSAELQQQAMADAARVAFGVELGTALHQLRSALEPPAQGRWPRWESWLTHAAAAATGSAATWTLAILVWTR